VKKGRSVCTPALLLVLVSPEGVEANGLSKNSLYACFGPRSDHRHTVLGASLSTDSFNTLVISASFR